MADIKKIEDKNRNSWGQLGFAVFVLLLSQISFVGSAHSTSSAPPSKLTSIVLAPTYAYAVLDKIARPNGYGGALAFYQELGDTFSLWINGQWTSHEVPTNQPQEGTKYQIYGGLVGVNYLFDILPLIRPSFEGGVGVLYHRFQKSSGYDIDAALGVCLDFIIWRHAAVGAGLHYHTFLSDPLNYPVFFDASARLLWRW